MCIACDTLRGATRVAVGTRDRVVQLFELDAASKMHCIFSVQLVATVPATVSIIEEDVYVFGFFDGLVFVYFALNQCLSR